MSLQLNMQKGAQSLTLALAKRGINTPPQADIAFNLDVSGSFDDEHRDGLTQMLLERLVPYGIVFDPDKKLDVLTFSNGQSNAHYVGEITPDTCDDYIRRNIIGRVPGYNGGTDYSYVLEEDLRRFGWLQGGTSAPVVKRGMFGGMFSRGQASSSPAAVAEKKRSIVLFVTDGENGDKDRTERVLAESESRGDEVYFLFIGISNQGGGFPFLKRIGDRFNNTGLVVIRDLKQFVQKTDDEINELLIGDELVEWLKK